MATKTSGEGEQDYMHHCCSNFLTRLESDAKAFTIRREGIWYNQAGPITKNAIGL